MDMKAVEEAVAEYKAATEKRQKFVDEWEEAQKDADAARQKLLDALGLASL